MLLVLRLLVPIKQRGADVDVDKDRCSVHLMRIKKSSRIAVAEPNNMQYDAGAQSMSTISARQALYFIL
jgi:hypothetical protein